MAVLIKKTMVLKPTTFTTAEQGSNFSGLIKFEFLSDRVIGRLNLAGTNGQTQEINLVLTDGKSNFHTFYGNLVEPIEFSASDYSPENICALLFFKQNCNYPFLYGYLGSQTLKLMEYVDYYAKNFKNEQEKSVTQADTAVCNEQVHISSRENANDSNPEIHLNKINDSVWEYDDEAVATENYYEREQVDKLAENAVGVDNEYVHNQTAITSTKAQEQTEKTQDCSDCNANQACANAFTQSQNSNAFYLSVKQKLDNLFKTHAPFLPLSEIVPFSKWIKIEYDKNSHYVVGLIYKDAYPAFIVYGVPGIRFEKPKVFSSRSQFLPVSLFECTQNGYWCIFQSANDGQIIYPNEIQ